MYVRFWQGLDSVLLISHENLSFAFLLQYHRQRKFLNDAQILISGPKISVMHFSDVIEDSRRRFNLDSWNCISFTAFLLTVDTPHFIQDARILISDPRSLIIQFPMENRINRCWIQFKLRKKSARNSSRNWNLQNPSCQMHFARFWLWGHMAYLTKNRIQWSKSGQLGNSSAPHVDRVQWGPQIQWPKSSCEMHPWRLELLAWVLISCNWIKWPEFLCIYIWNYFQTFLEF